MKSDFFYYFPLLIDVVFTGLFLRGEISVALLVCIFFGITAAQFSGMLYVKYSMEETG